MLLASQTSVVGSQGEKETKCDSLAAVSTLTQEVESLKVVVDLRNTEISQLKQTIADLQKQASCCCQYDLSCEIFFSFSFCSVFDCYFFISIFFSFYNFIQKQKQ